ncbi:KCNA2 [Symbiodinium natans]|uniref:KCNA2 protein n=1 Tax=Symbiodinium natans TaxID=878477 RepID=A0A812MAE4_9DINO|nr:KCNA2 [Symbiodinium natans]
MYLLSFIGVVDLLSLSAFIITLTPAMHDSGLHPNYDSTRAKDVWRDLILPLRLMRLMMLESWTPAIQSLCDVIWMQASALRKACYALVCVWYMFTVSLYVLEKDSEDDEISARFHNVLVGLPHGLIHLTGDYPCTNYSSLSMPFHLVFLILGMCCTGTFTGIFAGGFVEYLGAQRDLERRQAAEERVQIMVSAVSVLQRRFRVRQKQRRDVSSAELPRYNQVTIQKAAQRLLRRQTSLGRVFMGLAQAALIINILNTMLESIPEVEALGPEARRSLTLVEVVTGLIFAIEFFFHFLANPLGLFTTPMRMIDFVCLVPTIMRIKFELESTETQNGSPGMEAFIESIAACRIIRVLDWPGIAREVKAVKSTLRSALPSLAMPAVISLELWVLTAGIFVWLENMFTAEGDESEDSVPSDQEHMGSIPDALYWCSIYLLGEWANDEFTDGAGSRMCIFYCLCGVALFSIPVGIMVEAGQSTLLKIADERRELEEFRQAARGRAPVAPEKRPKSLPEPVKDVPAEEAEPRKVVD